MFAEMKIFDLMFGFKIIVIGFLCIAVSACGFQLRGVSDTAGEKGLTHLQVILKTDSPYGELEKILKRQLAESGSLLVDTINQAEPAIPGRLVVLQLHQLEFSEQGVSRDASGRANEIRVIGILSYSLTSGSETSSEEQPSEIKPSQLKVARSYYQDFRNPIGHQNQMRTTRTEIYQELSRRVLQRISRLQHSEANY